MTDSTLAALERAADALDDPDRLFTLEQVQYFMKAAEAWGYERRQREECEPDPLAYWAGHQNGYRHRVGEENADYPPAPHEGVLPSQREETRRIHRERVGVNAVAPRPGDFAGLGDAAVARLREAESGLADEAGRDGEH